MPSQPSDFRFSADVTIANQWRHCGRRHAMS